MRRHIEKMERTQRIATKMTPELRELPYDKRLGRLRLPSLQERRERGDLIMMYKLVHGKEKQTKKT